MFEPFSAIMAMQAAIAGIRSCAEMLSEGKSEVQRIKKAVADAKEIAAEIGGFFSWVRGVLGFLKKPPPVASPVASAPEPKAKTKPKEEWIEHIPDENEIVDRFVRHLSEFLRQQAALVEYIDERKRLIFEGKVSENAHEAALELVMLEHRIEIFGAELREMMTINAPRQLGPLYTKFNQMHGLVTEEQRAAKDRERREANLKAWRRDQIRRLLIDRGMAALWAMLAVTWMWGLIWSLTWPAPTLTLLK